MADDHEKVVRTAVTLWGLLALSSIIVMAIGTVWLVVRYRRTLKRGKRKRIIYHDMKLGNEFEEFENPFNEPDVRQDDGPTSA